LPSFCLQSASTENEAETKTAHEIAQALGLPSSFAQSDEAVPVRDDELPKEYDITITSTAEICLLAAALASGEDKLSSYPSYQEIALHLGSLL